MSAFAYPYDTSSSKRSSLEVSVSRPPISPTLSVLGSAVNSFSFIIVNLSICESHFVLSASYTLTTQNKSAGAFLGTIGPLHPSIQIGLRHRKASYVQVHRELSSAILAVLADINASLEVGAFLYAHALSDDVAGKGSFAPNIETVAGGHRAANLAQNDDFARIDVRQNYAIASDSNTISGKMDRPFHPAVDVERF